MIKRKPFLNELEYNSNLWRQGHCVPICILYLI
jgi:hypothetical protein